MTTAEPDFVRRIRNQRRWWLAAGLLLTTAAGCVGDDDPSPQPIDTELAALMDDGQLPDIMKGGGNIPAPPPRFCGGGGTGGFIMPPPRDAGGGMGGGFGSDGGINQGTGGSIVMPPPPGKMPPATTGFSGPAVPADGGVMPGPGPGPGMDALPPRPFDGGTDGFVGGSGGFMGGSGGFPMGSGGAGGQDPACASQPIAFWMFDDCNTFRTQLFDSSFQNHPAFRNVDLTCVADQKQGQATQLAGAEDIVYAPDQPDFSLADGVTVAAWIKPDKLGGARTLFRKRDDGTSAFALVLNGSNVQFIIRLTNGVFASVSAPGIKAGKWTHVAGTFDGKVVRVYINGKDVARAKVKGQLSRGAGPLLMGNDISGRRFQGAMDDAWFNTLAAPPETILALTCLPQPATATVTPMTTPALQPGAPATFQFAITNHNSAACQPASFEASVEIPPGFTADHFFTFVGPIASGGTSQAPFVVTSGDETDPGTYPVSFRAVSADGRRKDFLQAQANFVVAEPTGCHVSTPRELTIRDVSVVDDPIRTSMDGPAGDPRTGAWTFGRLMQRLAPSDDKGADVAEDMLRSFLNPQVINEFNVDPRPAMDPVVLAPWKRTPDGKLDLARAPMRLLAIVNRLDLKDLSKHKAGEGRLVFGVLDQFGQQMQFTVIFEYLLPATNDMEFKAWADKFHALQSLKFPSEAYNAALQAITDSFSVRGDPTVGVNGSSLIDIRTNEIALSGIWQLREFHLSPMTGFLAPAPLFDTPDFSFNFSDTLAQFINANEADIIAEHFDVPAQFGGGAFQAGAVFNSIDVWGAPGINNPLARHKFSLNTCNGCHGGETNTGFLQISPREVGQESFLSGFLTGEDVTDRFDGTQRHFNELGRRRALFQAVVCP